MNASEKMVEMFELVSELLTIPGLDDLVEKYGKIPEEKRIAKNGMRLKLCALCVKHAPGTVLKLAALEMDKSVEELEALSEKEQSAIFQQIVGSVIAPFLA